MERRKLKQYATSLSMGGTPKLSFETSSQDVPNLNNEDDDLLKSKLLSFNY